MEARSTKRVGSARSAGLLAIALGVQTCTASEPGETAARRAAAVASADGVLADVVVVQTTADDPAHDLLLGRAGDPVIAALYARVGTPAVESVFPTVGATAAQFAAHVAQIRGRFPTRSARSPYGPEAPLPPLQRFFRLRFPTDVDEAAVARELLASQNVRTAEPVHVGGADAADAGVPPTGAYALPCPLGAVPNDSYYCSSGSWGQSYPDQWGAHDMDLDTAWTVTRGDPNLIVAVIEGTGLDWTNPDLTDNVYVNAAEDAGVAGVDDDGNGYVDDVRGWNFGAGSNDTFNMLADHAMGVAGVIAANTDNARGMAGVMWHAKLLPLVAGDGTARAAAAVYAADNGASVINTSWSNSDETVHAVAQYAYALGVVWVGSAGNDGDESVVRPPGTLDEVIRVAGISTSGNSFGNSGPQVDVVAPAKDILTLIGTGATAYAPVSPGYQREDGTSFAAPAVAGVVGLLLSHDPTYSVEEIRQVLRGTATERGNVMFDHYYAYGEVNAGRALTSMRSRCEARITAPKHYQVLGRSTGDTVEGIAGGRDFASYRIVVGYGQPYWQPVTLPPVYAIADVSAASTTRVAGGTLGTVPLFSRTGTRLVGPMTVELQVFDAAGSLCGRDLKFVHYSPYAVAQGQVDLGTSPGSSLGQALAAGDVNGDGADDLLISDPNTQWHGWRSWSAVNSLGEQARVYLRYGGAVAASSSVSDAAAFPVSWLDTNGLDMMGATVAMADVDGDDLDDVVIAAPFAGSPGSKRGRVCVFLAAHRAAWARDMSLSSADYCFVGENDSDSLGQSLANAGDLDGDGADDLVMSSCGYDGVATNSGRAYVLYSSNRAAWSTPSDPSFDVHGSVSLSAGTVLDGTQTKPLCDGNSQSHVGLAVSGAGDFDGDGYDDLAALELNAMGVGTSNVLYVFPGGATPIPSGALTTATYRINADAQYKFRDALVPAGDVDGDGAGDLLVGTEDGGGLGGATLLYGSSSLPAGYSAMSSLRYRRFLDDTASHEGGAAIAGGRDLNSDGHPDYVITSYAYDVGWADVGVAWTIAGYPTWYRVTDAFHETANFVLRQDENVSYGNLFGYATAVGDFDGDGDVDVAVGAPSTQHTAGSPRVYLFSPH